MTEPRVIERKKRVAVLISGSGSNLQSLIDAASEPDYSAEIVLVVSNKPDAFGLTRAERVGIPTEILSHKAYASREDFDTALHSVLKEANVDFICLAGFMRIFTPGFVAHWPNRILNIHPSLLPAFPGLHVHRRAIEAGARFSGCTVHIVNAALDDGPIILQAVVPIIQTDTPDTLAARILKMEHIIYPKALDWMASGKANVVGTVVKVDPQETAPDPLIWPA